MVSGRFYSGIIPPGKGEMTELHGEMTIKVARALCDEHSECGGFTYKGSLNPSIPRNIFFFRFVPSIYNNVFSHTEWMSYVVDRTFAFYDGQVPTSKPEVTKHIDQVTDDKEKFDAEKFCERLHGCTAISLTEKGEVLIFRKLDLSSFKPEDNSFTLLKLMSPVAYVTDDPDRTADDLNLCCPIIENLKTSLQELYSLLDYEYTPDTIGREDCSISEEDFVARFVRTETPVILTGCDTLQYSWLDKYNINVQTSTKMFHDNATAPPRPIWSPPLPSITHDSTPNDFINIDEEVQQKLAIDAVRTFDLVRNNEDCKVRGTDCTIFENFERPRPIPADLYNMTGYKTELNWIITSSFSTGSHPHQDPDLTGAWNYLISGYKWWIILPFPIMFDINCNPDCSAGLNSDHLDMVRWVLHVLPVLRTKKFFGKTIVEGHQGPGEAIYLPHGMWHAVYNIGDNVALTENYLFVDSLPEVMKEVALGTFDFWRPGWAERAMKKFYYGYANAKDRQEMRDAYDQIVFEINENPDMCIQLENEWIKKKKNMEDRHSEALKWIGREK